ncbi:MAG: DNA polymerase/3'-5' exonuclease PolX [Deltaproteobacteria bacterium]|nr:DNA polymerase/3'-5' exonuclease PolX [Deltaproteobacteria bacterium]
MSEPDKAELVRVLREIGLLLQLKGESVYKVRAYEKAADVLVQYQGALRPLIDEGRLEELEGFGKAIATKISELVQTGRLPYYDELVAEFPITLLEVVQINGVGPKKAATLHRELGVVDLASLEKACREQRVRTLKGFGEKSELSILEGLAALAKRSTRTPLSKARPLAERALEQVKALPGIVRAEIAGSTRRWSETVGDLDIVASIAEGADPLPVMEAFCALPGVMKVLGTGPTKSSVMIDGMQLDFRVVGDADFGTALHHFTGSKAHHVKLRGLAREKRLTISEWGLYRLDEKGNEGEKLTIPDEAALYRALDMDFIPPELREDRGEIEAARAHRMPDLVELEDLQGITHAHTTDSDGANSVEEMAQAAASRGVKYLSITDHSRAAGYAHGMEIDRLKRQWDEIDRVNSLGLGVRVLKGSEVDILEDGTLDYPDEILEKLEVVIASIHSRFKMDTDQMTARISRAFDNPHLHIWGHATGRLIGTRDGYGLHMEQLLDKAAARGVAIEVNGTPARLDLSADHARLAKARGVKLVLSTDAHAVGELDHLRWAVATARRAGVEKTDVLTRLPVEKFVSTLRGMRH